MADAASSHADVPRLLVSAEEEEEEEEELELELSVVLVSSSWNSERCIARASGMLKRHMKV